MSDNNYHTTRLKADEKRTVLWSVLTPYLQRFVPPEATVLDFGAGHCDFINGVIAKQKIAFDQWDGIRNAVQPGISTVVGDYSELASLPESSVDVIFASNIFEHFTTEDLAKVFAVLHRLLRPGGKLICLQPNFYYAYRSYFDDYTHKSVWTHVSLPDFLSVSGYVPTFVKGDFLPLTVKSRLPVFPVLIRAYLLSPVRPMAGQMLVVAEVRK